MIEKVKGCFLGLAVGDALGVPVEFRDRSYFKTQPVKGMLGYGTWNQPPGTWSDDSSMSFCLAESLVSNYDLKDIASKFVRWYQEGYWGARFKLFDIGGTTRLSLARIAGGEDPLFAGEFGEESNGNGSLMRIAPAALYFSEIPDQELYDRVKEISSITHAHFRSVFSCFFFSKFAIQLFKGEEKFVAFKNARKSVSDFAAKNNFNANELQLFEKILTGAIISTTEQSIESGGYVLHTLEASVWSFLNAESYPDAVLKAISLGGDTDTTGCVTGALAGLYHGLDSIPSEWLKVLAREKDITKLSEDFTESLKKKILGKS